MQQVTLPTGRTMPALGQGTWRMGEDAGQRSAEVKALRLGMDLGMTLIDTAEMYGEGGAEEVVGEAIQGKRDELYIVSKVYPHNASKRGAVAACERSLKRLQTDVLDLYLLHWPGSVPIAETLEAFQQLQDAGKIRDYGVSNFDRQGMTAARAAPGGDGIVTNQVLYNLNRRGVEWDLLPWCREQAIPTMAYCPIGKDPGDEQWFLDNPVLGEVAQRHDATPAQIALAWLLQQGDVVAIPKAVSSGHIKENSAACEIKLNENDLAELDAAFPPPGSPESLDMR